jgi:hypothetical protein
MHTRTHNKRVAVQLRSTYGASTPSSVYKCDRMRPDEINHQPLSMTLNEGLKAGVISPSVH